MSEKILSVIVPSYNMEKYLPKCLGSMVVAPELMERLEVLVVNDGSKDRTSEIAHEFANKWPGTFKVIDKENGNYGSCINAGLAEVKGRYVRVLDADDWYDNEQFAKYLTFIESVANDGNPPVDLVLSGFDFVDQNGVSYESRSYAFVEESGFSIGQFNSSDETVLWMHAMTYRTEILHMLKYRQTEGLSYTDQEWVSIPMTAVRTVRRFPGSVYRYLNGREGQTCERNTYVRNMWQQIRITEGLVRRYGEVQHDIPVENRKAAYNHLVRRVRLIYAVCFDGNTPIHNGEDLAKLDARIRGVLPEVYVELGEKSPSKWIRFYCVKEWRKKGTDRTWRFFVFRTSRLLWGRVRRCVHG